MTKGAALVAAFLILVLLVVAFGEANMSARGREMTLVFLAPMAALAALFAFISWGSDRDMRKWKRDQPDS